MGGLQLSNRVFMAPLTRNRALPDGCPGELAALYYQQRATAGLIITEATQISPQGKGYLNTPGIHSEAHVNAWSRVTQAVHEENGHIFMQLWHVGRISHTSLQPDNAAPLAPSAIKANSQTFTEQGMVDVSMPRAMTSGEIRQTVEDYRLAAEYARKAGFDGVEVHAANGYLIDQFLQDRTNQRDDEYGGSIENRLRFLLEVMQAVTDVWGSEHVGVRLSPTGSFNDMGDSNPLATFGAAIDRLNQFDLAYLHMVENFPGIDSTAEDSAILSQLIGKWQGFYIANGGYDAASGQRAISEHHADAIAYGRPFIANPDLPLRLSEQADLNVPDEATFYGGDAHGYTDYPSLSG
jgi:N-ethylmaleimide reductase